MAPLEAAAGEGQGGGCVCQKGEGKSSKGCEKVGGRGCSASSHSKALSPSHILPCNPKEPHDTPMAAITRPGTSTTNPYTQCTHHITALPRPPSPPHPTHSFIRPRVAALSW